MYLDVNSWVWGKISTDAALLALCPITHMSRLWPNSFITLPILVYMSANQGGSEFSEDRPVANNVFNEFHVFVPYTASTTPIAQALDAVLTGMGFVLSFANEPSEPQNKVRHLVLKYNRGSTTADAML